MLLSLGRKQWQDGLKLVNFEKHETETENMVKEMLDLTQKYNKMIQDEFTHTEEEFVVKQVGKIDAKKHLEIDVDTIMTNNILQALGAMLATVVF